jgi:hypothetical protein
MKPRSLFTLVLLLACVLLAATLFAQTPTRYLLETALPTDITRLISQYGLTLVSTVHESDGNLYVVTVPPASLEALQKDLSVRLLRADVEVHTGEQAEKHEPVQSLDPLSDALLLPTPAQYFGTTVRGGYIQQTATSLIQLSQTQQQFPTGNGVVAVIDTGIDPTHPALKSVLVPGYDFTRNMPGIPSELADVDQSTVAILDQSTVAILDHKNFPLVLNQSTVAILDQSTVAILDADKLPGAFGHGTMVSGLIHLVAPTVQIMPLKAFRADGSANLSDVIRAIYYAVDHNAKVINMSFSMTGLDPTLQEAIAYAVNHGVICIASAGNEGKELMVYPAAFHGVFGVGSTNKSDRRSPFSNYGGAVKLSAPGEALVTTYPGNNYAAVWGTSFSAALASGASALVANLVPSLPLYYLGGVFRQGPHIGEEDARLDLLSDLQYCVKQPPSSQKDN